MTTASDHSIVASWTANEYTLSFDVNGGSGNPSSKKLAYDSSYGDLPKVSRDYYDFIGWYTAADGGTKVSSSTIMTGNTKLYAHWQIHSTSDWVLASKVPSGAKIVEEKWKYTLTEYAEYTSEEEEPDMSGWTHYDTEPTGYTDILGPTYSDPSGVMWDVTEERYVKSKTHYYVYYHLRGDEYPEDDPIGTGDISHEIELTHPLGESSKTYETSEGRIIVFEKTTCPECERETYWFLKDEYDDIEYASRWYYRDVIFTYYYSREVEKESSSDPSGNKDVSNVQKYVKYRAK